MTPYLNCVPFAQGKTHSLKPGAKDHVHTMAKGQPAPPMEDISMRIYLCEGLLGTFRPLLLSRRSERMKVKVS